MRLDKHEYWESTRPTINFDNIDKEATREINGGKDVDLNTKSSKRVVAKCEFCLKKFQTSLNSLHKNQKHVCCHDCSGIAARFPADSSIEKHEFFLRHIDDAKRKLDKIPSLKLEVRNTSLKSDRKITVRCDFCEKPFLKPIRYVDFNRGTVSCPRCAGVCSQYHKFGTSGDKHKFWLARRPKLDWSLIDTDETILKYGYDPKTLSANSSKTVVVKCCFCGGKIESTLTYLVKVGGRKTCKACRHKKNIETIRRRYGVNSVLEIPGVIERSNNPVTEQIVELVIRNRYGVDYVRNFEVPIAEGKFYSFDFFIPSCNLLVECQGDYFHDFKKNGYSGTPKDRAKATFVEQHTSFKLVHIWEHEIHLGRMNKILDFHIHGAMEPIVEIGNNKEAVFRRISDKEAHVFLSQYHYLGHLGTISTCYGGFVGDVLICVCTFGGTTRQNTFKKVKNLTGCAFTAKQLKELRRFCIRPNFSAKRFASFAIRECVRLYRSDFPETKAVISFADPTVGDSGNIYKYAGWTKLTDTGKSYHYLDVTIGRMIHKKTVWDLAKGAHMTEEEFSSKSRLVRVAEESKSVWMRMLQPR